MTTIESQIVDRIDYLEKLAEERDRRYEDRFKGQETAVTAALAAQKEQTASEFRASEKAIVKAEEAQRDTNNKSNEFRGQLKDQNDTMIPRLEANARFVSFDEKLDTRQQATDRRLSELTASIAFLRENAGAYPSRNEVNTMIGSINKDIGDLRESRSEVKGGSQVKREVSETNKWLIGIGITLVGLLIGLLFKLG